MAMPCGVQAQLANRQSLRFMVSHLYCQRHKLIFNHLFTHLFSYEKHIKQKHDHQFNSPSY